MTTSGVHERSVAVVGMSCRLPGANGPDQLWELLRRGADATSETPAQRYDAPALRATGPGGLAGSRAGYVDGIADFDADFFAMSTAEASALDPQQRLLLMCAWEAFEDSGLVPERLRGTRTGAFVGNSRADFLETALQRGLSSATATQLGNVRSLLAARLSHFFDLRGPSVVVDTACSSALTAVHQAVQSLRSGEIPVAVVAGVNLPLRPDEAAMMSHAGAMSADGRSRFGSADADGHAPADAVAVVVLKPLETALADGDRVRAVIAGSAVGASASGTFCFGPAAGASLPMGDYGDAASTGWNAGANCTYRMNGGWGIGGERLTARILWAAGVIVLGVVIITTRKSAPAQSERKAVDPPNARLKSVSSHIEEA